MRGVSKRFIHDSPLVEGEFQNIYDLLQSWKITGDDIDSESVGKAILEWIDILLRLTEKLKHIHFGQGSPNSAVSAPVGHIYLATDGGASTTLYVKESGTGDTGWVAK